jgi:hypothetical protein
MARRSDGNPEPVFIYTSVCCKAQATKEPCVMPKGKGIGGFGSKPEGEATLGSFRCSQCRRPAKVTRSLNPEAKSPRAKNNIVR